MRRLCATSASTPESCADVNKSPEGRRRARRRHQAHVSCLEGETGTRPPLPLLFRPLGRPERSTGIVSSPGMEEFGLCGLHGFREWGFSKQKAMVSTGSDALPGQTSERSRVARWLVSLFTCVPQAPHWCTLLPPYEVQHSFAHDDGGAPSSRPSHLRQP